MNRCINEASFTAGQISAFNSNQIKDCLINRSTQKGSSGSVGKHNVKALKKYIEDLT